MSKFLDTFALNPLQRRAVEHTTGSLIVRAGPGTGKTRIVSAKIAYLLHENIAAAKSIAALTFTKKAANEIRQRLASLTPQLPTANTFHGLCYDIIAQQSKEPPIMITEEEQTALIRRLLQSFKNKFLLNSYTPREIRQALSLYKSSLDKQPLSVEFSLFAQHYAAELIRQKKYDYDDLIIRVYEGLNAGTLSCRLQYLIVDEFQDTAPLQYEVLKLLTIKGTMCVIGDPLQSIYSFRGVRHDIFECFKKDFASADEIILTENYRSGEHILAVSRRLFYGAPKLTACQNSQGLVHHVTTLNEYTQADYIIHTITQKLGGIDLNHAREEGAASMAQFKDFAVLYRTHASALRLEKVFHDSGIPYQVVGSESLFAEPIIQKIIAELEMIPKSSVEKLSTALARIIEEQKLSSNSERITRNLAQFQSITLYFDQHADGVFQFLRYLEKLKKQDYYDEQAERVTLLTMHAAKGLEFRFVYIIGFEEGSIPFIRENDSPERLEEEKRLLYVALTRAKEELTVFSILERFGGKKPAVSSFKQLLAGEPLTELYDSAIESVYKKRQKERIKKSQGTLF